MKEVGSNFILDWGMGGDLVVYLLPNTLAGDRFVELKTMGEKMDDKFWNYK